MISQDIGRCECSLMVLPAQTTGPVPVVAESARRISPVCTSRPRKRLQYRVGRVRGSDSDDRRRQRRERGHLCGLTNTEKQKAKLARTLTAPGSAAVGPTRYGDRLLAAPIPTLWEPRRRAQTLQGRVAERAIAHQMARSVLVVSKARRSLCDTELAFSEEALLPGRS